MNETQIGGDGAVDPAGEQKSEALALSSQTDAKPWTDMIVAAQKIFQPWQDVCDGVDKHYANLDSMRTKAESVDYPIYWANQETVRPSVYSRPPRPVVAPRFKDRRPLYRETSEVLERTLLTNAEFQKTHRELELVRDDLIRHGRGVIWGRYDFRKGKYELACAEHLNRRDFLHGPARCWREVPWVARRAFLTHDAGVKRFKDKFLKVKMSSQDNDTPDEYTIEKKAEVWEIWHKDTNKVVWVSIGCDEILERSDPYLDLDTFWPVPEPVYGTLQPDSLIPIPDFLYYKSQIDKLNRLTRRIDNLSEALKLKGFFASGAEDLSAAIVKALKSTADQVMVPVPTLGATGQAALRDAVVWLPLDMVVTALRELVLMRRHIIEDVFQITGISDIMRGETQASETLGAQQLKSQFGAVRIRERQNAMVRMALAVTEMQGEIIAESFSAESIRDLSQSTLPSEADIAAQVAQLKQRGAQVKARLPVEQHAAADQQMNALLAKAAETVTLDEVVELLRSDRLRPYALDIETDSTIQPDEDAEKQRRNEFVQVVGTLVQNAVSLLTVAPEAAEFIGEVLQFATAPYRAGRGLEPAIDELVQTIKDKAAAAAQGGPDGPSAEETQAAADEKLAAMKEQGDMARAKHDAQVAALEAKTQQQLAAAKERELALKDRMQRQAADHQARMAEMSAEMKQMDVFMKQMDVRMSEIAASREAHATEVADATL